MLHILTVWYFDTSVTKPIWFRRVKFVLIAPRFAQQQYLWNIQPAVCCYISWTDIRCSGCSLLGENCCEKGLLSDNEIGILNNQVWHFYPKNPGKNTWHHSCQQTNVYYAYRRHTDNTCRIQTGLYMYKYYDIMHLTSYVLCDRNRKGSTLDFSYKFQLCTCT